MADKYSYDDDYVKKCIKEANKPTQYQGPDYDEEYLKQFENLPKGYKFSKEELEDITDKAYFLYLKERELSDRFSYPGFYDKVIPDKQKSDEQVWNEVERYYGSRNDPNFDWEGAKITFKIGKGGVSLYQIGRLFFQLMIKERYEK